MTGISIMFKAAKPTKVFQNVVDQIQEAILDGRLAVGQSLPAERELKALFGVSRGTLREALRVLEQKGLIEIRLGVGGGAVVKNPGTDQVSESLALLIRSQRVSLEDLAQFREDVEGTVAARAAKCRTPGQVAGLQALLAAAGDCVRAGAGRRDAFLEIDKKLHMRLAEITGNPIYISVLHSIHENIHRYYERYLTMDAPEMAENHRFLCEVVAAVEAGDAAGARRLVKDHVRRFARRMQKGRAAAAN